MRIRVFADFAGVGPPAVLYHEICQHCGCLRTTDTWAQNPENGVQGLTSVKYTELDDHEFGDSYHRWHDAKCLTAAQEALEAAGYDVERTDESLTIDYLEGGDYGDDDPDYLEISRIAEEHGCSASMSEDGLITIEVS